MRNPRLPVATCLIVLGALHFTLFAQEAPNPPDEAWRKVIEPSRVTVKFENTPIDEAFRKVAELTGNQIIGPKEAFAKPLPQFKPGPQQFEKPKPVTMEFINEPFWKAVGALEAELGTHLEAAGEALAYRPGRFPAADPAWTVLLGPARVQLGGCIFQREEHLPLSAEIEWGVPSGTLGFEVDVEPRVTAAEGSLLLTELTDDTGRDLLAGEDGKTEDPQARSRRYVGVRIPAGPEIGCSQTWGRRHGQQVASGDMVVPIGFPAPEATKIRSLKGRLDLNLSNYAAPMAVFVKDLDKPRPWAGTTFSAKLSSEGNRATVEVTTGPSKAPADVRALLSRIRLVTSDDAVHDMDRGLSVEPPKTSPDGSVQARLSFWVKEAWEFKAVLLPDMSPPRHQSWDFELHDIPLPPRKSLYAKRGAGEAKPPSDRPIPPAPEGIHPLSELHGSTFTLKADNMLLTDAAAEITRQTGNRVNAPGEKPVYLKQYGREPYRITGNWENVEFWPGIAAICHAPPGLAVRRSNDAKGTYSFLRKGSSIRLGVARTAPDFEVVQFFGPMRLEVQQVTLHAVSRISYGLKPETQDALTFDMTLASWKEPSCLIQSHGARVEECVTSAGADLMQRIPPGPRPKSLWPAFGRNDDPRCTWDYRCAYDPDPLNVYLTVPLQPADVADRIARLRVYYTVETFDDPNRVEIAEPTKPSTHKLRDGLTIEWKGIEEANGRRELAYHAKREGGLTGREKEMLSAQRIAVLDAHGERISFPSSSGSIDDAISMRINLAPGQTPAKALISLNPKIYAGIVEFRDIPLPVLSELP